MGIQYVMRYRHSSGKEMVERLTNLIAIFENPALDFSQNRANGDDLLGDAYEYLMRHFATESGKSKGQFTPGREDSNLRNQNPLPCGLAMRHNLLAA
jgi:type I restriction enzyme M protein